MVQLVISTSLLSTSLICTSKPVFATFPTAQGSVQNIPTTSQGSVKNIPPLPRAVVRTFLTLPREVVRTNVDWPIFCCCTTSLGSDGNVLHTALGSEA